MKIDEWRWTMSRRTVVCTVCVCLGAALAVLNPTAAVSQCGPSKDLTLTNSYIGLYSDEEHTVCDAFGCSAAFTMWIWCRPSDQGLNAAEFKIDYPQNVVKMTATRNPDIYLELGTLESGTSVAFSSCQTDWVWTHRQDLIIQDGTRSWIRVVPNPSSGFLAFGNCEWGIEVPFVTTHLALNMTCDLCVHPPRLSCVTPEGPLTLHAEFVLAPVCDISAPFEDNFVLCNKADLADSMAIVQAVRQGDYDFTLTLERTMVNGTTYVLRARNIWNCGDYLRGDSQKEFLYDGPTATLLQGYAAELKERGVELSWRLYEADEGISFAIARSTDGGAFTELDALAVRQEGLEFVYTDSGVEPETKYSYKVEYVLGGERRLLFVSEPIETPAARLALYQNRPNPFNPSTTISFSLPSELVVSLEVYDVSGRLVARPIGAEKLGPGLHSVRWNGTDTRGAGVSSGIYIYRLAAGKSVISRKMVFLK
jgi:hypothetical protein